MLKKILNINFLLELPDMKIYPCTQKYPSPNVSEYQEVHIISDLDSYYYAKLFVITAI